MTTTVMVAAGGTLAGLVALWAWAMNRIDERAERRHIDEMRRREPPVLGGGPQHLRARDRRR